MSNSRTYKKGGAGEKKEEASTPPPRTPRAGEAEIGMVKALYANDPDLLALKNRKITNLGLDGVAVMFDDPDRESGLAVVRINGVNRSATVTKRPDGFYAGDEKVEFKGWIHTTIQVFETEFNAWPKPGETLPL